MKYQIQFISQVDLEKHVKNTIDTYGQILKSIDLKRFNSNVIDPIKLLFDKNIYNKTYEEIINNEIFRQRDKSNTNAIGYFHQNIFEYLKNCVVPKTGWDVIYTNHITNQKIYVEMKNKHNTMNSSSAQKTYIKMQNQILQTPNDLCFLVEVIAPNSRNVKWECCIDSTHVSNEKIRRLSIDKFYEIVTGEKDAFYQLCSYLPYLIEKIVSQNKNLMVEKDTVLTELRNIDNNLQTALFKLAFKTYEGFVFK